MCVHARTQDKRVNALVCMWLHSYTRTRTQTCLHSHTSWICTQVGGMALDGVISWSVGLSVWPGVFSLQSAVSTLCLCVCGFRRVLLCVRARRQNVCVCVCVCVRPHTYICTYTHLNVYVYMCMRLHAYTYIRTENTY